jgi:nucleoside-diphosphate-sugar epimerase
MKILFQAANAQSIAPRQCEKHPDIERVLVIGGAGVIGSSLIPELRRAGYSVRALQHHTEIKTGEGIEIVSASLTSVSDLTEAMRDVQAVCLLVRVSGQASPQEWIEGCIQGTWNVLEACRNSSVRRVVIGCGDNVFGVPTRPTSPVLTEMSTRRSNGTSYSMVKLLEHELIRQYRSTFNVPVVLAIFPFVWRDDLLETGLKAVDHSAKVIYHELDETGTDLIRPGIHLSDATRAIMLALRAEQAIDQDFLFSAAEPYSSSQLMSILSPAFPYRIQIVRRKWQSWRIDFSKAVEVLGYKPEVDLLAWLSSQLNHHLNRERISSIGENPLRVTE